ncbi:zinc-binding dehydrogenase [Paucilactobacillus suebicus]|uniref:Alcohol dehydrogenase n=1 Tax=Paucilactobacillus suebicus DSM 5007 = KCTC 3549 TaxID=1423807 RepID=A0A0R1W0A7_9LACO|nr:zinc-binding dehydrogenase [Paucilactobacillus suebicus]KRM11178.1 alcohol dehydrogenase [Paucilactobacillus suebicus DSM 5007 = KCTC 3549]
MNTVIVNEKRKLIDQQAEVPYPHNHDVLVKIHDISINPIDIKRIHRITNTDSRILGYDAIGEVVSIGSKVSKYTAGDMIFYAGSTERNGSYQEYQLVDERITAFAPKKIPLNQAAATPLTWLTAYEILVDKLGFIPQKNVNSGSILVINGAGGAGSMLTQLAHWMGLTVLATSSAGNFYWLKRNGVDVPLDYHNNIVDQAQTAGFNSVDHVVNLFDTAKYFNIAKKMVRPFGHIVNVALTSEKIDIIELQAKSISFDWELMFTKSTLEYNLESQGESLALLANLLDNGQIKSTITRTIVAPLAAQVIRQAHNLINSHTVVGKIVVDFEAKY